MWSLNFPLDIFSENSNSWPVVLSGCVVSTSCRSSCALVFGWDCCLECEQHITLWRAPFQQRSRHPSIEQPTNEPTQTINYEGWFAEILSFIHIKHLYSASSRELLRGAPDSSTAKRSSLKVGKKRRWQTLLSGSIVWSRRLAIGLWSDFARAY